MEIPDKLVEIESKLKNFGKKSPHPGLVNAYASAYHNRNPRIATILLVGLTGTGKSSTINMLFNNDKLAETGGSVSCTTDLIEYEMLLPYIEEIDTKNLKLRIIDTPGFGDTRDPDFDAKLVATLKNFFSTHEDLAGERYPTIVLICGKFDDTRYSGENSSFVKMLKGLEFIKNQIFDTQNNNVVVCMTHLMNSKKELRHRPDVKCVEFSTLVGQFTCIKNPPVVVAENEADDKELEKINGFYKLPNGEYYPKNLFNAIQTLLAGNHDNMGEIIIRTVFKDLNKFEVKESRRISMLSTSSREVNTALNFVNRINYQIKTTQITENIQRAWATLSQNEQNDYPSTLLFIERVFERNKIYEMSDLPNTPLEILKIVKDMQPNPLVARILEQAVGIQVPKLNISLVTGQCYNIINFKVNTVSIFDFENKYDISPLGYLLPSHIQCDTHNETTNLCEILANTEEYIHKRLNSLSINVSLEVSAYGGNLKSDISSGYNIMDSDTYSGSNSKFTASRETKMFRLTLKNELKLSQQFQNDVKNLPNKFLQSDYNTVENFKTFFTFYGTHVVASCFGGGSIEIACTADKLSIGKSLEDKRHLGAQVQAGFMNKFSATFGMSSKNEQHYSSKVDTSSWGFSAILKGGDMEYHSIDLATMSERDSAKTYTAWMKTVELHPLMLTNQMHLIPISNYVREFDVGKAEQIENATNHLFKGNLVYVAPTPPPPPPPRHETKPPPSDNSSSCLKKGTQITMATGDTKEVENVRAGDILLDMNLRPTRVIGTSFVFIGRKDFYGFDEMDYFFTTDHIMVGKSSLLVASKSFLHEKNPMIKSLKVVEFQPDGNQMLKYEQGEIKTLGLKLYKDPMKYDPSTKIYYLLVDSPSGTYIANGYVARHELPDISKYPELFTILRNILVTETIDKITMDKEITPVVFTKFEFLIEKSIKMFDSKIHEISSHFQKISKLQKPDISEDIVSFKPMEEISKIIGNDCKAMFAMILYEKCAKKFQEILDNNFTDSEFSYLDSVFISKSFIEVLSTFI